MNGSGQLDDAHKRRVGNGGNGEAFEVGTWPQTADGWR
jgi:hypothetical protein